MNFQKHFYEVRSWTKCSTRRFVIAFHHFGTPILFQSSFSGFDSSKCQFVSAFYEVDSSFPEFDSSFSHSWSFWRFVVSLCRFDMAFPDFDSSTLVGYNSLQNT